MLDDRQRRECADLDRAVFAFADAAEFSDAAKVEDVLRFEELLPERWNQVRAAGHDLQATARQPGVWLRQRRARTMPREQLHCCGDAARTQKLEIRKAHDPFRLVLTWCCFS